jgi:hypothetical protein
LTPAGRLFEHLLLKVRLEHHSGAFCLQDDRSMLFCACRVLIGLENMVLRSDRTSNYSTYSKVHSEGVLFS